MASVLDFLAQANASINQAAKEQAHREALAAAFLNVPAQDPAVKQLANRAQQMLEADRQAKAPTAQQKMRGTLANQGHLPGTVSPQESSALSDAAARAAKSIADEIDARERNLDAASAYLGILDKTDPAVRRLAQGMDGLLKKQATGAEALRKTYDNVARSAAIAVASNAAYDIALRHFGSAASPGLIRAWDGALGILQARIGGELLPLIDQSIDTIMSVADWFASLTDAERKLIAGSIVAVPALMGISNAAAALAPAGRLAWTTLTVVAQRFNSLSSTGKIAVGALGGFATGMLAIIDLANQAKNAEAKREESLQDTGRVREKEFENVSVFGNMPDAQRRRLAEAPSAETANRFRENARKLREKWNNPGFMDRLGQSLGVQTKEQDEQRARLFESLADRLEKFPGVETRAETDWRAKVRKTAMRVDAVQRENRPAYSNLADARKQLQLQTLGKNQYEREILREQRKHREQERKQLDELIRQGKEKGYRFTD